MQAWRSAIWVAIGACLACVFCSCTEGNVGDELTDDEPSGGDEDCLPGACAAGGRANSDSGTDASSGRDGGCLPGTCATGGRAGSDSGARADASADYNVNADFDAGPDTCNGTASSSTYTYCHATGPAPDLSWLPLGNGRGHLLVTELPAHLPIINTMKTPASGRTVVNNQTQLAYDYVNPHNTDSTTKAGYSPSTYANVEGLQPVVSFMKGGTRTTVWPMQMTPMSRAWVNESNILRTVTGTAEFRLMTDDFIAVDRDMLVRIFTVQNLTSATASFRLLNFLPINPSGRNNFNWENNWKAMAATNYASYDAATDCLIFSTGTNNRWIVASDTPSSGHQCATAGDAQKDITDDGALSGVGSAGPGVVEGAQSYDSPSLAPGDTFTVTTYVAHLTSTTTQQALQDFAASYKNATGTALRDSANTFWQSWLDAGKSGLIADAEIRKLTRRLLTVLKASTWDIGGLSAVPAELSGFYTRDSMPTPRALALFGYWNDAKQIMLAHEAYMAKPGTWTMNSQDYDPSISAIVSTGFTDATAFANITEFSYDDPAVTLFTIGEIWNASDKSDAAYLGQAWPYIKWLVARGEKDMGTMGTIAQNSGFQDDMLEYAWGRPAVGANGAGIECSFFNMLWVSALEMASGIGTELGHPTEAAHYQSLADSIRNNLEAKFWNESRQEYAYIHVATEAGLASTDYTAVPDGVGGSYIFPNQTNGNPWGCIAMGQAFPYFYHYADNARARASLNQAKATIEPLPTTDLVIGAWGNPWVWGTANLTDLFYAEAAANDSQLAATKDWFLQNVPLGGMPEVMPTNDRSVQSWMVGETLCALHKYVETTGGF